MPWVPESIRLFNLCEATRWSHLPVAGGWYDQHPQLIEEWTVIFNAKARRQAAEAAKQKHQHR